jgi:hypothetical protein
MSRYQALALHLSSLSATRWRATFSQIEKIIGGQLPQSALNYPAWWANQKNGGHSQTMGWLSAGWETAELDLANQKVTFLRLSPISAQSVNAKRSPEAMDESSSNERSSYQKDGLSIAEAKAGLSVRYDIPIDKIEITMKG